LSHSLSDSKLDQRKEFPGNIRENHVISILYTVRKSGQLALYLYMGHYM